MGLQCGCSLRRRGYVPNKLVSCTWRRQIALQKIQKRSRTVIMQRAEECLRLLRDGYSDSSFLQEWRLPSIAEIQDLPQCDDFRIDKNHDRKEYRARSEIWLALHRAIFSKISFNLLHLSSEAQTLYVKVTTLKRQTRLAQECKNFLVMAWVNVTQPPDERKFVFQIGNRLNQMVDGLTFSHFRKNLPCVLDGYLDPFPLTALLNARYQFFLECASHICNAIHKLPVVLASLCAQFLAFSFESDNLISKKSKRKRQKRK